MPENILINVIFIIVEIIFILFTLLSSSLGAYLIRKGKPKKGLILVLSNISLLTITFIRSLLKKDFAFKGGMFAFLVYNRQELYSTFIILLYIGLSIYTIYNFNILKKNSKLKDDKKISKNVKNEIYLIPIFLVLTIILIYGSFMSSNNSSYHCHTLYIKSSLNLDNHTINIPNNSCYTGKNSTNGYGYRSFKSYDKLDNELKSITNKYNNEHTTKVRYAINNKALYNEYFLYFED